MPRTGEKTSRPCPHDCRKFFRMFNGGVWKLVGCQTYGSDAAYSRHKTKLHPLCSPHCPVPDCTKKIDSVAQMNESFSQFLESRRNSLLHSDLRFEEPSPNPNVTTNLSDVSDDLYIDEDDGAIPKFSCSECDQLCVNLFSLKRHMERTHIESTRKIKEAKFATLQKILTASGFQTKQELAFFVLSCLTSPMASEVIIEALSRDPAIKLQVNHFLMLPFAVQNLSLEREKEKRHHLGKLNITLKLGEEGQGELNSALSLGFSKHQFRHWKDGKIRDMGICASNGKSGYSIPLPKCIQAMFPCDGDEWGKIVLTSGNRIPLTISTDGGSMDRRNGAVIVKIQRRDDLWTIGNRFKKPNLNATHAVLFMKETYENLRRELAPLYAEMEKPFQCTSDLTYSLEFAESNDMKMSLLLLGLGPLYLKTEANCCFRCREIRGKNLPTKHHFDGAMNLEDYVDFRKFDDDDKELGFSITNDLTTKQRTLESIKTAATEVSKIQQEVADKKSTPKKLKEYQKETGVVNYPITTVSIHLHHLELIHLTEGVAKRVVKLMIVTIPANSRMEERVKVAFKRYGDLDFRKDEKLPLWKRLDKTSINRVKWLQILAGFFSGFLI
jgi:hypothetical protein